jgi:HSP20 family protein
MTKRTKAEEMFTEIFETLTEKQKEVEKFITDYSSKTPQKLKIDVIEDEEHFTVLVDLPGVRKDNITIDISEDKLEITADFDENSEDKNFVINERNNGIIKRAILLPKRVKMNQSSAKFNDGVLTVILSKLGKNENFEVKVD